MSPPRPRPGETAHRQRQVRTAVVLIVLGLLVQAWTCLAPGMWRMLGFLAIGTTLVLAGCALSAVALFRPTRPPPVPETASRPAEEPGPT